MDDYEKCPKAIEQLSFQRIRELIELDAFDKEQQQVVMRVVHSLGLPHLAQQLRFSSAACDSGMQALSSRCPILCDVEMVRQGVTKRMIDREPLCFLNHEKTAEVAAETGETRSMAALQLWLPYLADSVVIIGNAPTALFRLLEMLEEGAPKPALIIAMPVGFVGAAEAKKALWERHQKLAVPCITLLGREGGSGVAAASCNALLRCLHGEYY